MALCPDIRSILSIFCSSNCIDKKNEINENIQKILRRDKENHEILWDTAQTIRELQREPESHKEGPDAQTKKGILRLGMGTGPTNMRGVTRGQAKAI